ncbi:MAG: thiopeptide-type bacteriocin biosynthesis protein, partial [Pseudonocardiaceae bacterium]
HDLFHADSRHLLDHLAHADHDHRREVVVILATRLLRAAGQDCYEQGDCWTQLATHRTPALGVVEPSPSTAAAVQRLITATTDTAGSPLHTTPTWVDAFEHAGRRLADLPAHGHPRARTVRRAQPAPAVPVQPARHRCPRPVRARRRSPHTLATTSFDSTVRLWNVTDPAHPTPLGQP